jgi:hypothetical protein
VDAPRLQARPDTYGIIAALQSIILDENNAVGRLISMRELAIGMILGEDIRAQTGTLGLAKGHEVTKVLLERLRSYAEKVDIVEPFRALVPHRQP